MKRRTFLKLGIGAGIATALGFGVKNLLTTKENIDEKVEILKKEGILAKVIQSKGNKTLIFIGEVHLPQTVQSDINLINAIGEAFQTNNLALEGWAGEQIDKHRGFEMLNGQPEVIKHFRSNSKWNTLPLDDPELQLLMSHAIMLEQRALLIYLQRIDPNYKLLNRHKRAQLQDYLEQHYRIHGSEQAFVDRATIFLKHKLPGLVTFNLHHAEFSDGRFERSYRAAKQEYELWEQHGVHYNKRDEQYTKKILMYLEKYGTLIVFIGRAHTIILDKINNEPINIVYVEANG